MRRRWWRYKQIINLVPKMEPNTIKIRAIRPTDTAWIRELFIQKWAGDLMIIRGKAYQLEELSGYIAELSNKKVGLITFRVTGQKLEITSLNSLLEKKGVGSTLVNKVLNFAKTRRLKSIRLITTNDNLNAIGFWQKRGFKLLRIYPDSLEMARKLKPALPFVGENGIPLRDEIELEMKL
jgi:N-acetylglutamate synthase-like GNAT family acetyltransferase